MITAYTFICSHTLLIFALPSSACVPTYISHVVFSVVHPAVPGTCVNIKDAAEVPLNGIWLVEGTILWASILTTPGNRAYIQTLILCIPMILRIYAEASLDTYMKSQRRNGSTPVQRSLPCLCRGNQLFVIIERRKCLTLNYGGES